MQLAPRKPTAFSALFKQFSSPTIVTHGVFCNILHHEHRNLVLVRSTNLEIYEIVHLGNDTKFSFVTSSQLYEEIQDIAVVRFYGDNMDSILISFKEAKVAAMNFDIHSYELKTCSLHTYETPSLKGGRLQFSKFPLLRVDPLQRCAVMLVYDRYLAVLPFRRADALSSISEQVLDAPTTDSAWQHKATAPILSTFTTLLSTSTGEKINNVLDMQFLFGFYEPTLFVLYEPVGTWAGRVSARRDTCCIVALSLNLQKRTNPVIWFQGHLPFDCHTVLPIPMPIGGVLVIATNSIIYLKQTLPSCGLPVNCYARASTNFPLRQNVPDCGPLSLDDCRATLINPTHVLITSRTGNFYVLTLLLENATSTVTSLLLSEVGCFVQAECLTLLDNNCLFVGSCLSDSLLLRYHLTSKEVSFVSNIDISFMDENGLPKSSQELVPKRPKLESANGEIMDVDHRPVDPKTTGTVVDASSLDAPLSNRSGVQFDETDADIYGVNFLLPPTHSLEIDVYNFEAVDCLCNLGPMACITAGEVPCLATGQTDPSDETMTAAQSEMAHIELIAGIARSSDSFIRPPSPSGGNGGGLAFLHRSIRANGLTAFELPEYNSLWSLYGPPVGILPTSSGEEDSHSPTFISKEPKTDSLTTVDTEEMDSVKKAVVDGQTEVDETNGASGGAKEEEVTISSTSSFNCEHHSYLLLTREDSTMILEVGEEIVELEVSGFNTSETTIIAANLGQHCLRSVQEAQKYSPEAIVISRPASPKVVHESQNLRVGVDYPYILQVSPTSIRLLDGPHLLEHIVLTTEWRVYLASISDPYLLVGTEDDDLVLACLRPGPLNEGNHEDSNLKSSRFPQPSRGLTHTSASSASLDFISQQDSLPFSKYLELSRPKVAQVSAPLCFCLFHDKNGRLSRWLNFNTQQDSSLIWTPHQNETKNSSVDVNSELRLSALDEEDILLYGEVINACKKEKTISSEQYNCAMHDQQAMRVVVEEETSYAADATAYFAFVVFSNGVLEIYSVPDFTCLYEVHHFSDLPSLLCDNRCVEDKVYSKQLRIGNISAEGDDLPPMIREISVFCMGHNNERPVLFVRTVQEVVCYEALCALPGEALPLTPIVAFVPGVSPLRWRRLPASCPLLAPRRLRSDPRITDLQARLSTKSAMLRPFEDIGGHRGVFVCGSQPMWLFGTKMGHIRVFPHTIDGVMTSFAPLNTSTCPHGFVYFTHANEMRLATLPQGYSYEGELGARILPLDSRPHFIQYHLESKTYVVVSSIERPCTSIFRLNAEGNKEEEVVDRPATCIFPTYDVYKLQVMASALSTAPIVQQTDLEVVPNSLIKFEPFEIVSCLVTAQLASEQTFHGTKDYLALGSNLSYGEEIPVRGRIMLIDIIDVVPEPGQPLTRHRVKTVFDGDQKGPVTALASCQGHLISAVGQKIYIWTLKNADLIGMAFVDTDLYIHSLLCVKNLILAADVLKSIQLLRFQASMRVLSVVSRDSTTREIFATNFFVDGSKLGFLITDKLGNLVIYSYDPMEVSSCSGRRLVPRADMRLPSRSTSCLRVANRFRHPLLQTKLLSAPSIVSEAELPIDKRGQQSGGGTVKPVVSASSLLASFDLEHSRHSVYFGTQTGAIYLITPIRDKMLSRFRIIEKNLVQCVGCIGGLIPRVCRQYNQPFPELANHRGNVADGDLVWRYLTLPHAQRLEVAKKSGQSLESIMDDIAEVSAITLHF